MKFPPCRLLLAVLAGLAGACSKSPVQSPLVVPDPASKVADLTPVTGNRAARLVWLEADPISPPSGASAMVPAGPDIPSLRIYGYDAADGLGLRPLTPAPADFARPLLTADGKSVVYTRLHATAQEGKVTYAPEVILQPWQGAPRPLGPGMAVDLWRDPVSGSEYIYAAETLLPGNPTRLTGEKLLRFLPDKPDEREILWTATPFGTTQFQLSRDGHRAAGCFPFPKAGLADLTTQTFTPLAAGAWAAGAPDDSYAAAIPDGSRRRLRFFAPNLDPGWELTFMGAPGWQDGGLLHPRWSNDPGLLIFTGPHTADEPTGDLSIVRFREDFRSIILTARLTTGRHALSPDLWVEAGAASLSSLPQQPITIPKPAPLPWPAFTDELTFAWDHFKAPAKLPHAPVSLTPKRFAAPGRYFNMDASNGWFEADPAAAAAMARASAASSAWSMELILTERPAQPPLSVRLAALLLEDGREAFALYRVDRKLVLRILLGSPSGGPAQVHPVILTNLAIESDRPIHLLLSLRNNRLACWVDGQMQKEFQLAGSGLAAWGPGPLTFGDPQPYGTPWSGTLERIAIWSRSLGDDEIRQAAATALQYIEARKLPLRAIVKANPAPGLPPVTNPLPDNLLSIHVWDIRKLLSGQLEPKRIAVATWSRLHGQALPPLPPATAGAEPADLVLETMEDHPELEGIPRIAAPGAADLPLYFAPRSLPHTP